MLRWLRSSGLLRSSWSLGSLRSPASQRQFDFKQINTTNWTQHQSKHDKPSKTNWDERLSLLVSVCCVLIDVVYSLFCVDCLLGLLCTVSLICWLWAQIVVLVSLCWVFQLRLFNADYCSCFVFAEFFFPRLTLDKVCGFLFAVFVLFKLKLLSVCWAQFVVTQYFLLRFLGSVCSTLFLMLSLLNRNGCDRFLPVEPKWLCSFSFCWGLCA